MKIICVDDERLINEHVVALCRDLPGVEEAHGFHRSGDALRYLQEHDADVAILDIDVPDMDGIELASRIKESLPQLKILFLSGFAGEKEGAHGYLTKPVNRDRLREELAHLPAWEIPEEKEPLYVRTFGGLELLVRGKAAPLEETAREMLALLVDQKGCAMTREELGKRLWPDREASRTLKKQTEEAADSLCHALKRLGREDILEAKNGTYRIEPRSFACDAYRFAAADIVAVNSYQGGYLRPYAWASLPESLKRWKDIEEHGGQSPAPREKPRGLFSWFGRK